MEEEIRGNFIDCFSDLELSLIDKKNLDFKIGIKVKKVLLDYNKSDIFNSNPDTSFLNQDRSYFEIIDSGRGGYMIFYDKYDLLRETSRKWVVGYYPSYETVIRFKIDYSKKVIKEIYDKKILESLDMSLMVLNQNNLFTKQLQGLCSSSGQRSHYKLVLVSVVPELQIIKQRKNIKLTNVFTGSL